MGFTAFAGRKAELATLHSCLEKTVAGKGQFVTIMGEAGLGKGRLVYEFRHGLNRSKITFLQGRCQSYGTSTPYFPHINALRRRLNLRDGDTAIELHEKAVSNVLAIDSSLEKYMPVYLHLLSIPSQVYPLPQHLHGRELTNAILEALSALFILNSQKRPMVLAFEDWHWVDEASDSALKQIISLNGKLGKAIEAAEKALGIFRQTEERYFGAWALFAMAKIQSDKHSGQPEQLMQRYLQAKDLAGKLKMRPLLAHCRLERGQFYTRTGENEKARSELLKAIELYRFLGMRFWQPKAEAKLNEVS